MFDVFVSHHSGDRNVALDLCEMLRTQGINPWIDHEQLRPGAWVQHDIRSAINATPCALICLGPRGLGPWQTLEIDALVERCVAGETRLIPTLLPGVSALPDELLFLRPLNFVRFGRSVFEVEPLRELVWGITGERIPMPRIVGGTERDCPTPVGLDRRGHLG